MARDSTLDGEFPSELGGGTTTSTGGGGGDVKAIPNRVQSDVAQRLTNVGPWATAYDKEKSGGPVLYNNIPWGGSRSGVYLPTVNTTNFVSAATSGSAATLQTSATIPSSASRFPAIYSLRYAFYNPGAQADVQVRLNFKPTDQRWSYHQVYDIANFTFQTLTYPATILSYTGALSASGSLKGTLYFPGVYGFNVASRAGASVFGNYGAGAVISGSITANQSPSYAFFRMYGVNARMSANQTLATTGYTQTP